MTERERKFSDAIDVLFALMDEAPNTAAILRLSTIIGLMHDALEREKIDFRGPEPEQESMQ